VPGRCRKRFGEGGHGRLCIAFREMREPGEIQRFGVAWRAL
jgi:hypothetical protein